MWLAGEAGSDEIHRATPWAAVKGGKVIPDRSLIQGLFCHPRHENGCRVGLPLDSANKPGVRSLHADSEFERSDSCAQGEGM
jgi:hypothetical protein